jgi:hypothetical protein
MPKACAKSARSSTDRTSVSGTDNVGPIPAGRTRFLSKPETESSNLSEHTPYQFPACNPPKLFDCWRVAFAGRESVQGHHVRRGRHFDILSSS